MLAATFASRTRRHCSLQERIEAVARAVEESTQLYRPDVVAVVDDPRFASTKALSKAAIDAAIRSGAPVRVVSVESLAEFFADSSGDSNYDRVGQTVTRVFFPELSRGVTAWRRGGEGRRREIRPMWKATAAAITTLAEYRPAAIAALAREPLPTQLALFIERASRASNV